MWNLVKNPLKVALCIIGTLIGAGFASGQEIMSFFIVYGKKSFWGLVIFAVLLSLYLFCLLGFIHKKNISTYNEYLELIIHRKLSMAVEFTVLLFTLSSFIVMLSGFGEVVSQAFHVPNVIGSVFLCAVCYFIFSKNATGIVNAGAFFTPVIIVFIIIIGVLSVQETLPAGAFHDIKMLTDNYMFSSLVYVSYNTLSLTPVLIGIKKFIKTKKDITLITIFSSLILGAMAIIIWYSLVKFEENIMYSQIPMLDIAVHFGGVLSHAYTLVLFCAMLTTAISSGFAFLTSAEKILKTPYQKLTLPLCVMSTLGAQISFSALISHLYGFFGYIGIAIFIIGIIQYFLKK